MSIKDLIDTMHARASRQQEIRAATKAYPGVEIGEAYRRWKEARGETATLLSSRDQAGPQKELDELRAQLFNRPCTRPGCAGTQALEPVCGGCIEGQAGYKTKWTCKLCMHRDLSKEGVEEWLVLLSGSLKP